MGDQSGSRLGRWFLTGSWAVIDQGLFSVSNFALQVVLVRWLDARDYGAFTVAFSCFLLVANLHTAVITEPALVLAPGEWAERQPAYFRALIRLHLEATAVLLLGLLCVPAVMAALGEMHLARAFLAIGMASPAILSVWLARRLCYAVFQPRAAAIGGAVYLLVMLAGIYGCYRADIVSVWSAGLVLALASLLGIAITVPALPIGPRVSDDVLTSTRQAHRRYAGWLLASSPFRWAPSNLVYVLLPVLPGPAHGLEASGLMRAVMNLVMPLLQAYGALGTLLLPTFANERRSATRSRAGQFAAIFMGVGVVYWLVIGLFGDEIMRVLYGTRAAGAREMLWTLGALPILTGLVAVLQGTVMAAERPKQVFIAYLTATVVGATAGIALVMWRGTFGAALANVLGYVALALVFVVLVSRNRRAIASS